MHCIFGVSPNMQCFFMSTIVDDYARGPPSIDSKFWIDRRDQMKKNINNPKRRKSKDNPYIIKHLENNNTYIVIFNSNNVENEIQINKQIYDTLNQFELEDLKQMNEKDRHYERLEQSDEFLYKRSLNQQKSVEEVVEENIINEELKNAINMLTNVQKRRLKMYFFDSMSFSKIAKFEKCSVESVRESINSSIKKIKKVLKI